MGVKGWILVLVLAATPAWAQEADSDFFGSPTPSPSFRFGEGDSSGHPVAAPQAEPAAAPADTGEALGINPRFESSAFPMAEDGGLLRSALRTVTAVGFVLALIFGLAFFAKRYILKGTAVGSRGKFIRVVDTLFLGPRKNLMVVEAFGDKFLLATVGSGVQFLSRVNEHRREARPVAIEEEAPAAAKPTERRAMGGGAESRWSVGSPSPKRGEGGGMPLAAWKKTMLEEIQRLKRQA
ncbi:MAG: FliO/MopB family protein [Nitrospirae bacterium]|nr:FliO/MopB family protein [Nitrospirota bacterium]